MWVALVFPSWTKSTGIAGYFAHKASLWLPLNLAYLGALAEKAGHSVTVIDAEAERLSIGQVISRLLDTNPRVIGITSTTPFYHDAVRLAREIKQSLPLASTVLGGAHITILQEEAFDASFDYACLGEADKTWPALLDCISKGVLSESIPGILYWKNGQIINTGKPKPIENMDELPVPARHLLNNDLYTIGTLHGTKKMTTIMTVRGCPFQCIFCSTKVFGRSLRKRSPEKVVEEMRECVEDFGVQHFFFLDDTLTLYHDHILEICTRIIDAGLDITFEGSTRANMIDEELVQVMVAAGLIRLSFGLESANENIRTTMKKNVPLKSYTIANKLMNKYGVEALNSCMIGLPGETEDTVRETLAFLRRSKEVKQANISIAVPYPGTELYYMAKNGQLGLKLMTEDFSKYKRYGAAVMTVGDLSPQDLIDIQNEAFLSIYLAPWRWPTLVNKWGFIGALLNFSRIFKLLESGKKLRYLTNKQLGF